MTADTTNTINNRKDVHSVEGTISNGKSYKRIRSWKAKRYRSGQLNFLSHKHCSLFVTRGDMCIRKSDPIEIDQRSSKLYHQLNIHRTE